MNFNTSAHAENAKLWETAIGVDCYLPAFCDISNNDDENSATEIRKMGKDLIDMILENSCSVPEAMTKVDTLYLDKYKDTIKSKKLEIQYLYQRSTVYLRLYGIFWDKYHLNFFDPCLIPIPREKPIDFPKVKKQINDLHQSLVGWYKEMLKPEVKKLEYSEFRCLRCKSGKITITMSTYGSSKPDSITELECFHCEGSGKVTLSKHRSQKYANNMWCKCEEEYDADYYKDGEHDELSKHHWRCTNCQKVTQIG